MFYAAFHNGTKVAGYRISPGYNDEHFEIFTDDIPLGRCTDCGNFWVKSKNMKVKMSFYILASLL